MYVRACACAHACVRVCAARVFVFSAAFTHTPSGLPGCVRVPSVLSHSANSSPECVQTHTLMQARTSSPVMSSTASSMATGSEGGGGQIFSAWEEMKSVKIAANVSGCPSAGGGRSLRPAMGQHSPNGKSGSLACSDAHCPAGRWE